MSELIAIFEQYPGILSLLLFLTGISVGSFLNVVILRLPALLFWQWREQSRETLDIPDNAKDQQPANLIRPRSRCPKCSSSLKSTQNIPILGYLFLAGKCGFCRQSIAIRYPIIELLTGLVWVLLGVQFGPSPGLIFSLILSSCFIALAFIDFDHQILPDVIVLPLLWIGIFVNSFEMFTDLQSSVIGAIAGYLVLWTIYQIHHRLSGKEGMGYGDFKLLSCIGAWVGWQCLPIVILIASLSGTVFAVSMMLFRKQSREAAIAFGPYLIISGWIALMWGDILMENYLQIFRI